ncbi:MAG: hypothetical protein HRT88_21225, partial [Lentisphaeraceae bacterium]|nr:hypothetical protein [Lentisphaeraceae bacterium]
MLKKKLFSIITAAGLLPSLIAGQAEINDVLSKMPAKDQKSSVALNKKFLAEGPQAIINITKNFTPFSGKKEDTKVSYLLREITDYISRPGTPAKTRQTYEAAYVSVIKNSDAKKAAFIMDHLRWFVSTNSIDSIAPYLNDDKLGTHALRILMNIAIHVDKTKVTPKIRAAYAKSSGANKTELLKALGSLRDTKSLNTFINESNSKD